MKTKWAVLAGFAAIMLWVTTGCFETAGGSSSNDRPGSTNKPVIVQICFTVPTCSADKPRTYDGAAFNAGAAYLYMAPSCPNTDDNLYLWIKVVSDLESYEIDYYEWSIRGWSSDESNGIFDDFDTIVDTNGVFTVRTSLNEIGYISPSMAKLLTLASVSNQGIDVTVMAKDGRFTSAAITLKLYDGMITGDNLVYGALQLKDAQSELRPGIGIVADYFRITGTGATNMLGLIGSETNFATALVLYNTNLTGIATNEGLFSQSVYSEITHFLTSGMDYFVEATSAQNQRTGSYTIINSTGPLTPIPNPFVSSDCSSIAGTYAVDETRVIDFSFNGQSHAFTSTTSTSVTIGQEGCDIWYQVNDPTGLIPPMLRLGRLVTSAQIELYSDSFIPESPGLTISASSVAGDGFQVGGSGWNIKSSGTIQGEYLGLPFTVNYSSSAAFTK